MTEDVIIEAPDNDGDGKPDAKITIPIKDPRVLAILGLIAGVLVITKAYNLW